MPGEFWSKFLFLRKSRHGILGVSYHVFRFAQFVTLVTIIGLTGQFVGAMDSNNVSPPSVLVGILALVSLAALYLIILSILFWDEKVGFLWPLFIDAAILAGFIVVAVVAGRPLSYINCSDLGSSSSEASDFAETLASITSKVNKGAGEVIYTAFIAATKQVCTEMKSIWGLVIADCIFFAFTLITGMILYFMTRARYGQDKSDC